MLNQKIIQWLFFIFSLFFFQISDTNFCRAQEYRLKESIQLLKDWNEAELRNAFKITLSYDAQGAHVEMITDPIGRELRYAYRGLHLITFTDARNFIHTYNYNEFGYLSSMVDPNNVTFVINQYNDKGKVIFQDNAHGHQTAFSYDESTKTTVVKGPLGNETTYVHDERNRLIKKTNSLGKYC